MEDGEQKGIMPTKEALALAHELGLDLVEIAARSHPPVCRIMDYGKYKYEQSKKKKQAKKHASTVELKEIKFRPKTDGHDRDFKIKHVRRFLEEGNKCRLVIIFRGREITHPETGRAVLDQVVEATKDIANVEVNASMEGRRMVMILAPKSGVMRRARQIKEQDLAASEGKAAAKAAAAAESLEGPDDEDLSAEGPDDEDLSAEGPDDEDLSAEGAAAEGPSAEGVSAEGPSAEDAAADGPPPSAGNDSARAPASESAPG